MPAGSNAKKAVSVMKDMKAKKDEPPMKAKKEKKHEPPMKAVKALKRPAEATFTIGLHSTTVVGFPFLAFTLEVKASDTIDFTKASISAKATLAGLHCHHLWCMLDHRRVVLEDGHTLRDYNIQEGDELAFDAA
jgi:hypothetical protein